MTQTRRRLAATLAVDVPGYSRLMGADEEGTLECLKALRRELVDPKIAEHKGRLGGRALALNPNFARGWHISGIVRYFAGQPDVAIEHVEGALRLSPRARIGRSHALTGYAHFLSRRFDEVEPKLLLAIQGSELPGTLSRSHRLLRPYGSARRCTRDRHTAAGHYLCRDSGPEPTTEPEHRELYLSGLRLAAGGRHEPDPPPRRDPRIGQQCLAVDGAAPQTPSGRDRFPPSGRPSPAGIER